MGAVMPEERPLTLQHGPWTEQPQLSGSGHQQQRSTEGEWVVRKWRNGLERQAWKNLALREETLSSGWGHC